MHKQVQEKKLNTSALNVVSHQKPCESKTYKKTQYNIKRNDSLPVTNVPILSANGAGCISKIQSIIDDVYHLAAAIVTLQETLFQRKGKFNGKLCDFEIFEAIRKKNKGGH